jgi:hypothetical protein
MYSLLGPAFGSYNRDKCGQLYAELVEIKRVKQPSHLPGWEETECHEIHLQLNDQLLTGSSLHVQECWAKEDLRWYLRLIVTD